MTKEKFQILCERVLVPRIGDLMHLQLTTMQETVDLIAQELVRIETLLSELACERDAQ